MLHDSDFTENYLKTIIEVIYYYRGVSMGDKKGFAFPVVRRLYPAIALSKNPDFSDKLFLFNKLSFPNKLFSSFLFSFLMLLVLSSFSAYAEGDWCCTGSDSMDPALHCVEFSSEQEALDAGCSESFLNNKACSFTDCANPGCCVENNCEWTTKENCLGNFHDFMTCKETPACEPSCCILNPGTDQEMPMEGHPGDGDWEQRCDELGGRYYPKSCKDVDGTSSGSLRGNVVDSDNKPLVGVRVFAGPYREITDESGEFYFSEIPVSYPNSYSIKVYLENYQQKDSASATIRKDQEFELDDIIMQYDESAFVTIKGKVVDQNENGISSASIILDSRHNSFTDNMGYYTMVKQVSNGSYEMIASKSGYEDDVLEISISPGEIYDGYNFVLEQGSSSDQCNNNGIVDLPSEECDGIDDDLCPGRCRNDCTCMPSCEESGYFCTDVKYQCDNVGGKTLSDFDRDCDDKFNQNIESIDGGFCCNTQPTDLPLCMPGEAEGSPHIGFTNVDGTGGSLCKCGENIGDIKDSSDSDPIYCCLVDGEKTFNYESCQKPGGLKGLVYDSDNQPLEGVLITLSSLYRTNSNSSDGLNYIISNVAPGDYEITASMPGYKDYSGSVTISQNRFKKHNVRMIKRSYSSGDVSIHLSSVKGKNHIKITAEIPSDSDYYKIYRDGRLIAHSDTSGKGNQITYLDKGSSWDTEYKYNITAYGLYGAIGSDSSIIRTGNSACEDVMDAKQFCASRVCFDSKSNDFCGFKDEPPKTHRVKCSSNNMLVLAHGSEDDSVCDTSCVEFEGGSTICAGDDSCLTLGLPPSFMSYNPEEANLFGFYYDESYSHETCMIGSDSSYKYCYYDNFYSDVLNRQRGSYKIKDQCLNCDPDGFCYNYQSEEACLKDNCRYGDNYDTECIWQDTYSELGKGICYSNDTSTTDYCGMCNEDNPVFYNFDCTPELCSMLGNCYSSEDNDKCLSCDISSACSDFDGDMLSCIGDSDGYHFSSNGYPQAASITCDSSTIIEYGDDSCGIGLCRYVEGRCIKDADFDDNDDCSDKEDKVGCNSDWDIPSTQYDGKNFISSVQNEIGFFTKSSVSSTFYCLSSQGEYCCPEAEAESGTATFPNSLYDFEDVEKDMVLWFYSTSDFGNPEEIKSRNITVDTVGPKINIGYSIKNSSLGRALSDVVVTLKPHEDAVECSDILSGKSQNSRLEGSVIEFDPKGKEITFAGLEDGSYLYSIECSDIYGNVNRAEKQIIVDRVKKIINPQPNFKTINYTDVDFSFDTYDDDTKFTCFYQMSMPYEGMMKQYPTNRIENEDSGFRYYAGPVAHARAGTYAYDIRCYDSPSKEVLSDTSSFIFTIDDVSPNSEVYVMDDGFYEKLNEEKAYSNTQIMINCSDRFMGPPREFGCSGIDYCISDKACDPASGEKIDSSIVNTEINLDEKEKGLFYICYRSYDTGFNYEESTCKEIFIDKKGPELSINIPTDESVIGISRMRFEGTWKDDFIPSVMYAKISNEKGFKQEIEDISITGDQISGSFSGIMELNSLYEGINTISVVAFDNSGNKGSATSRFYYDGTSPVISSSILYGEDISGSSGSWVIGGGSQSDDEIVLDFFKIFENNVTERHHEFGYRLKAEIVTNDDKYMDINNRFGSDVIVNVTISNSTDDIIKMLSYNSSINSYDAIFDEVLEVGSYEVLYSVSDKWGNRNSYKQDFEVKDTNPPFFEVEIFNDQGRNVTDLKYGKYDIVINPSEPIDDIFYLNYSFSTRNKVVNKNVILTKKKGDRLEGELIISTKDLDFRNLNRQRADFYIMGKDTHSINGSSISSGRSFTITTTGPMKPLILTPDTSSDHEFYTTNNESVVEGIVYLEENKGLREGEVVFKKNRLSPQYSDSSWVLSGDTDTNSNSYHEKWSSNEFDDKIIFKDNNTINLNDYGDFFVEGRYISFRSKLRQNLESYKIISKEYTSNDGVKQLYDISLEPELSGFEGFTSGDSFSDVIDIYDTHAPDGWFSKEVDLNRGVNHFYVNAFDGPNIGYHSDVFTLIRDDIMPVLINTSPYDGVITGDNSVMLYAFVDPTITKVKEYKLSVDGVEIDSDIFYNEEGFAKIYSSNSLRLNDSVHTANVIITDMAGNTLNHQWSFTIDSDVPVDPLILPSNVINDNKPEVYIEFNNSLNKIKLDEAIIYSISQSGSGSYRGNSVSGSDDGFKLNLTNALSYDEEKKAYVYQLSDSESLSDGQYSINVKARRIVGESLSSQGLYISQFEVDTTPPEITSISQDIEEQYLSFSIVASTDEPAKCRYSTDDVSYNEMSLPYFIPNFTAQHNMVVYDLPSKESNVYVRCIDAAGNMMPRSEVIDINVDSLLYPAPRIIKPSLDSIVVKNSSYNIIGTTFDSDNPFDWVPGVPIVIAKSNNLYSGNVDYTRANKYNTISYPYAEPGVISTENGLVMDDNSILIQDSEGLLERGKYVDFSENRRDDYLPYEVLSVIEQQASEDVFDLVKASFADNLPSHLNPMQTLYVYPDKALPGWFEYDLELDEGYNYFYATAKNKFGEGYKTKVYELVKDTTHPILDNEKPQDNDIISLLNPVISIDADGTYSDLSNYSMKIDQVPVSASLEEIGENSYSLVYQADFHNDGFHSIDVKVTDIAGNSANYSWSFEVDTSVPSAPNIYPRGSINTLNPEMDIQFSENVVLEEVIVSSNDFEEIVGFSYPSEGNRFISDIGPLEDGAYMISVKARKPIENSNNGLWHKDFSVDTIPPNITSIPSSINAMEMPISFIVETNEDAICRYSSRDQSYSSMTELLSSGSSSGSSSSYSKIHDASVSISSNSGVIYVRCIDSAGNPMSYSRAVSINLQQDQPTICGDGIISGEEQCDGNNFGDISGCSSFNQEFTGGELSCHDVSCQFVTDNCVSDSPFCSSDDDCLDDKVCVSGYCISDHCTNGRQDNDEEGVDCGGSCQDCQTCGNGKIERGESCDGSDFGNIRGCSSLPGFSSGSLSCNQATCEFDTSNCVVSSECGNGIVESGESCDGSTEGKSCSDFGFTSGNLICSDNCEFDTSECVREDSLGYCGDGEIDPGEQCDLFMLPYSSCNDMSDSYSSGYLSCLDCEIVTSSCVLAHDCGDGVIDPGEQCDSNAIDMSCSDFESFLSGNILCNDDCSYDTSGCIPLSECGNDIVDQGEQCDGSTAGRDCLDFGFDHGELTCDGCRFDTSDCITEDPDKLAEDRCGDGNIDAGEECDNPEMPYETCNEMSSDYISGELSCSDDCEIVTDSCQLGSECGDGKVSPGEECDSGTGGLTCSDFESFSGGELSCSEDCTFDTSSCFTVEPECGNGIVDLGEQCDGSTADRSCLDFGFAGGSLSCNSCMIDTSDCLTENQIIVCGDGNIDPGEECDYPEMPYETCNEMSPSFLSGRLFCQDCKLVTDLCTANTECGNSIVEPGEECDSGIEGLSCSSFDRFTGGNLACTDDCRFDTSGCMGYSIECGDSFIDPGEHCEPLRDVNVDCDKFDSFLYGEVGCTSDCRYDLSDCSKTPIFDEYCGNGIIEQGEQCDGNQILCSDIGFGGVPYEGIYASCITPGNEHECMYNLTHCGVENGQGCNEGDSKDCSEISNYYVDGQANCVDGFYNMSSCWTSDVPEINTSLDSLYPDSQYIDISGYVSNALLLELYVNGNLIDNVSFSSPLESYFTFADVYLPESTEYSDGINEIMIIAYGPMSGLNYTFSRSLVYDPVGPSINMLSPSNLHTKSELPELIIGVSKRSNCSVSYDSYGETVIQDFVYYDSNVDDSNVDNSNVDDSNVITDFVSDAVSNIVDYKYSVMINHPLTKDRITDLIVSCTDQSGFTHSANFELYVDTIKPVITNVSALLPDKTIVTNSNGYKEILVYQNFNSMIRAKVDSEVKCRYGVSQSLSGVDSYDSMYDYDPLIIPYLGTWETRNKVNSELDDFSIYTLCKDKAGWVSDPYQLHVRVEPDTDLIIENLNNEFIGEEQPDIELMTNRYSECSLIFQGRTEKMDLYQTDNGYKHKLNLAAFNNKKLEHNNQYEFRAECNTLSESVSKKEDLTFYIISDLVSPNVDFIDPVEDDVFRNYRIKVMVDTEKFSNVMLYRNSVLVDDKNSGNDEIVSFNMTLVPGHNYISVTSIDRASNENSSGISVYYDGDKIPPELISTFPDDGQMVTSVKKLYANVKTAYGIGLDLSDGNSDITLYDSEERQIDYEEKEYSPGTPQDPLGNFTLSLENHLPDGNYTWKIELVDELGIKGHTSTRDFIVNRSNPVIKIISPVYYSSNDYFQKKPEYHTAEQSFLLSGSISSESNITEAWYQLTNDKTGEKINSALNLNNGRFNDVYVEMDNLEDGEQQTYGMLIHAENKDGLSKDLTFKINYDLLSPSPVEVRVDDKVIS